jgi:hypothetical protein
VKIRLSFRPLLWPLIPLIFAKNISKTLSVLQELFFSAFLKDGRAVPKGRIGRRIEEATGLVGAAWCPQRSNQIG